MATKLQRVRSRAALKRHRVLIRTGKQKLRSHLEREIKREQAQDRKHERIL